MLVPAGKKASCPFPSRGRSPSQKLHRQQPPGPVSSPPHRRFSSLPSPESTPGTDLVLRPGHRSSSPGSLRSDGTNGRVTLCSGPSGGVGGGSWHSSAPALRLRLSSSPSPLPEGVSTLLLLPPPPARLGTGSPPRRGRLGPAGLQQLAGRRGWCRRRCRLSRGAAGWDAT